MFAEMGPDGEDGLTTFLQTKLKGWQSSLNGYKQLADTGNYPGEDEITQGLTLINPLIADKNSEKFIERSVPYLSALSWSLLSWSLTPINL